jgi:hypothetical protein
MMEVITEFYGEDEFVPYGPKSISNLWSEFRNENKESMTRTKIIMVGLQLKQVCRSNYFKFISQLYKSRDATCITKLYTKMIYGYTT